MLLTGLLTCAGAGSGRWQHQLCVHCEGPQGRRVPEAGPALRAHRPRLASDTGHLPFLPINTLPDPAITLHYSTTRSLRTVIHLTLHNMWRTARMFGRIIPSLRAVRHAKQRSMCRIGCGMRQMRYGSSTGCALTMCRRFTTSMPRTL